MALDTPDGLFARIQLNLGRGSHATIVSYIPEWVNITQRTLCKEARFWFCHAEDSATTLVAADDTMTLPTDFIDDDYIFLKDSDGALTEVVCMDYLDYRKEFTDLTGTSEQGIPRVYVLRETDILFRPISDDTYTVILGYWKMLADLVAGGATNKLLDNYQRILECGATAKGFEYLQEYDDSQYWQNLYEAELSKIKISNAERQFPDEMTMTVKSGPNSTGRMSRTGYGRSRGY